LKKRLWSMPCKHLAFKPRELAPHKIVFDGAACPAPTRQVQSGMVLDSAKVPKSTLKS